ncbi:MBL fold metallo-hydrolase [Pantoea deleyi]|uniref:MBL fold metallo-hydrolase n=1 Tax=Pantoea deleyi TaxID=470932 RepID=UPI002589055B|nr:MBL fold metallo-hydrolase [uncultured Pantoea sp.]
MTMLCTACGTAYPLQATYPHCKICEDERQYVPADGQHWIALDALRASHANQWKAHSDTLLSIKTVPAFAINQRAFLLRTPHGNVLWDCIANLDDATCTLITALGGIDAIAISHPHYYTTMQEWAEAFNAPIHLHARDRQWIVRESPHIRFWEGESLTLMPSVTLMRLGGHFPGGSVLHWDEHGGVMLAGDIIQVTPGAHGASFMWSYPNMLPLSAATVGDILHRLAGVKFDRLYGAFDGQDMRQEAKEKVMRSGARYLACLRDHQA